MRLLDRYILRYFITTYLFTLGLFVGIAVVFDLTERLDALVGKRVPIQEILFDYYFNLIPYLANLFSPLFVFVAVIFFTARLAARSEVVAMLGSGIPFGRLMYPYLLGATLIAGGNWYLAGYVLPPSNKKRIEFDNRYFRERFYFNRHHFHFQPMPGQLAYVESYSTPDSTGFRFTLEHFIGGQLRSKLMCERIRWNGQMGLWTLEDCHLRRIESKKREQILFFPHIDTSLRFTTEDFGRPLVEDAALLDNRQLEAYIARERLKGSSGIEPFLVEKHNRLSIPFSAFILTLMGVSLSSRKVRGGIGLQLGVGVGLCFAYIMLIRFALTFAIKGNMPPMLAAWTPNLIFMVIALYLYRVAPK
ncbi:MAG: YjgP/YjgQ family permease [Sphingomonadales bacterium]|nr:YjgP/YjgQ family permease [Sphingomonadales bacterium]